MAILMSQLGDDAARADRTTQLLRKSEVIEQQLQESLRRSEEAARWLHEMMVRINAERAAAGLPPLPPTQPDRAFVERMTQIKMPTIVTPPPVVPLVPLDPLREVAPMPRQRQ